MLRIRTISPRMTLYCSLTINADFMTALNCATTGGSSGHEIYKGEKAEKVLTQFREVLRNATVDDFNFKQLTDPDAWNQYAKGSYRTANGAFFTLLYRYNQLAEREGKPTITEDDIVEFIKDAADNPLKISVERLSSNDKYPTGNDKAVVVIMKAPIRQLLKGKDLGILGTTTAERLKVLGPETNMYIKVAFQPTYSRDAAGELTVLEEGIQPISFHRDADSKNTAPKPENPDVKDEAWDTDYIPENLVTRAPKEYFKKEKERKAKKQADTDTDET